MTHPAYEGLKGLAYPVLASVASCDHNKAVSQGYANGWQMLLDLHDASEMAAFCTALPRVLSAAQSMVFLDGLAREFTQFETWDEFTDACVDHPEWKPSQGPLS
jgi:hypothetical protein